jgi:hypothetical protein
MMSKNVIGNVVMPNIVMTNAVAPYAWQAGLNVNAQKLRVPNKIILTRKKSVAVVFLLPLSILESHPKFRHGRFLSNKKAVPVLFLI